MAENGIDAIAMEIRKSAAEWYPWQGEASGVRVVSRTPRNGHYVYEVAVEFDQHAERVAVKLYRGGKSAAGDARRMAAAEYSHLCKLWETAREQGVEGIPRPLGDFSSRGAVVNEKLVGVPLQSMILKAALIPGYAEVGQLQEAASASGAWLRSLQRATAQAASELDTGSLQRDVEALCERCRREGLDTESIAKIVTATRAMLEPVHAPVRNAAVLHEFTPMHVVVLERGVGFGDYATLEESGCVSVDPASFLAAVEVLEKYPFCDHRITSEVQRRFLDAYGGDEEERAILGVYKMRALLAIYAAGRVGRESPARKKVMWANVMKKFMQTVAERALPSAA